MRMKINRKIFSIFYPLFKALVKKEWLKIRPKTNWLEKKRHYQFSLNGCLGKSLIIEPEENLRVWIIYRAISRVEMDCQLLNL
jgi:hypothetical protein